MKPSCLPVALLAFVSASALSAQSAEVTYARVGENFSVCVVREGSDAPEWVTGRLDAAGQDTLVDGRSMAEAGLRLAPPLPHTVTALAIRDAFQWDRGNWGRVDFGSFMNPARLEQVGEVQGSPIFQPRGSAASAYAYVPMAPCVYRSYRNEQLYHPM